MEGHEDDFVPRLGMEYQTLDEAWSVWSDYGGRNGFGVRRGCGNKSKKDDVITSKFFLCNCEGKRGVDKRDSLTKKPRAETRTGCQAHLLLKFDRGTHKYKVIEFVKEHNHPLQPPEACYLIPSQRKVPEIACYDIQVAASSGISPKNAYGLHSKQHGGIRGLGYTMVDHNNCLRNQRKKAMQYGAAVAMTKYFAKRSMEDKSFKHFEDTSDEGEISNVVWADAKMIASYIRFGDVVVFDTTFGTNNEKWALGTFVGFNYLREIEVFGVTLMCDQKKESFQWVFTKFLEAHGDKKPITMFTDQDAAIMNGLKNIMPDTRHGLCTWHINQNRLKYLKAKNDDESKDLNSNFNNCLYRYDEEKEFEDAFNVLIEKVDVKGKSWLNSIYEIKEKWAYCFMKDAHTLGIRSTQMSESFNSDLKDYLNCKLDVCRFMEQFDRLLAQKREKEIKSEYEMRSKLPRLNSKMPILREASNLYTPKVFDLFQAEVEFSMEAHIECLEGNTYTVGKYGIDNETPYKSRQVVWSREDQMVSCSCKKFEREGILCWHTLKVLDREDIKEIPPRYILNRWTRAAKVDTVVDVDGRRVIEDPMLVVRNRNADLVRILTQILCDKVGQNEELAQLVRHRLLELQRECEQKCENLATASGDGIPNSERSLHLKKKNGGDRGSKRKPSCIEKKTRAKKAKNKTISNSQDSLCPSTNPSQHISEVNFGCFSNLEGIYGLTITQDVVEKIRQE